MYILYCDETNLESHTGDFFIYGGIAVHSDRALPLSSDIDAIRSTHSVPRDFILKFNPKPDCLDHDGFKHLKQMVIEAAVRHDAKLLTSVILHDIATSPDDARLFEINRVLFHFNCLLNREKECGFVLIDRFSDPRVDDHLREKFTIGLTGMPYSREMKLERIIGIHYSAIGQSHFGSLTDIVLGSMRYATNTFTRAAISQRPSENALLRLISPLFVRSSSGKVADLGMNYSPKIVRAPAYLQLYKDYQLYLRTNAIDTEQEISDQRTY